jgi:hypothetical protein
VTLPPTPADQPSPLESVYELRAEQTATAVQMLLITSI